MPLNPNSLSAITSTQNPRIKELVKLRQAHQRRASGRCIIEGRREIDLALRSSIWIEEIFFFPAAFSRHSSEHEKLRSLTSGKNINLFEVNEKVYDKISFGDRPEGIIAVARPPELTLSALRLKSSPLIIIAESIEKPGNLGAMLRTADAAGVDALVCCDERVELYNPNVIRASLGAIFTVPCVQSTNQPTFAWLKKHGISVICATPEAELIYSQLDLARPSALVVGNEPQGVSAFWKENADRLCCIPMLGQADSLNVSVSTAIIIYEAVRQRVN